MKKHLGWLFRMAIAAAGVAYILYTLTWSDQVSLPAGYSAAPGINGGEAGETFRVWDGNEEAYLIGPADSTDGKATTRGWFPKSELGVGDDDPQFKPSFFTILSRADVGLLIGGLAVFVPVFVINAFRWGLLLRARGIDIGLGRAYRLIMAGAFFNLCMPGTTGGDVMKAYYASKGTHKRADAVVSVGVDRACGLIGLMLLVGILGLFSLDNALIRRLAIVMWCGLGAMLFTFWIYASPSIRARLRLGRLVGRVPGAGLLRKFDGLVKAYRHHIGALFGAVVMSLPIQIALASAMTMAGYALGVEQPLLYLLSMIPIVMILWSLPVSGPLGLGPLDYVAVQLIVGTSNTTAQEALMMFVAYRLYAVAVGLCGSLALIGIGAKPVEGQALELSQNTAAETAKD